MTTTTDHRIEWRDLSESELRMRLYLRGMPYQQAYLVAYTRDAAVIERVLKP